MITKSQSLLAALFLPFVALGTLFLVFVLYLPTQAKGGTYVVNTTEDTTDGSCNAAHCTLREAILAANASAKADTITFSLPPSATITLGGTVLPYITGTLTIDGSTAENLTISGDNASRIFLIGPLPPGYLGPSEFSEVENVTIPTVTLSNLTITNGNEAGGFGGGIFNDGRLTIKNSTLTSSTSGYGGIIHNNHTLTVTDSVLSNNSSTSFGGAIFNVNYGSVSIINSEIISNTAGNNGGGIFNGNGRLTVRNSTFVNNSTSDTEDGGAIFNDSRLTVENSTFGNNFAYEGGAIFSQALLTVTNSTFNGNIAVFRGGGIHNKTWNTVTINNSTFYGNSADSLGGGGGIYNNGDLNFSNTIFANSLNGSDCANWDKIITNINNLVEDGSCSPAYTGDPLLGPLQDNGGNTWTHALLDGSPAIDAGDPGSCAAPPVNNLDQRGKIRPADGDGDGLAICDIGAHEVVPTIGLGKNAPVVAAAGEFITYTLTAVNNLTTTVTNVVLTDTIPTNATYISGGTLVGNVVSWTLPSLAVGETFTRSFIVTATQTITNHDYRVSAAGGYSTTGSVPVVTIVVEPITGLVATNNSPTTIGDMTTLMASVVTGDDVSYTWAFGDGDTGSGANTTHTYPDVGVYTAVVTATNSVSTVTATTVVTIEQDTWTIYLPVVVDQDGNAKQAAQPPPLSLKRYWR
jgi:CSLREA domain-containing protein/uncharacterized repeat protein (TIGR01451 family)